MEDLTPSNLLVTKFTTHSGHCITCDRRVESRAPHQPPAADVPHGQIGLNALALGVMLRARHRLPFRQISVVLQKMAGLSPGGLAKQLKRIARWLRGEYGQLILRMRASGVIYSNETGWRIDGQNAWAWVLGPARGGINSEQPTDRAKLGTNRGVLTEADSGRVAPVNRHDSLVGGWSSGRSRG